MLKLTLVQVQPAANESHYDAENFRSQKKLSSVLDELLKFYGYL